jgi:hypothetical protein
MRNKARTPNFGSDTESSEKTTYNDASLFVPSARRKPCYLCGKKGNSNVCYPIFFVIFI